LESPVRRILWAEDSDSDRVLIRQALQQMPDPPAVDFVEDGVELLDKLAETKPGLLVIDLGMPRMGGLEVLQRLKAEGVQVGIVVFTAHDGRGEAMQCRRNGAHEVIQKPTAFLEFVFAVQRIVTHSAWTVAEQALEATTPRIAPPR
jgi:CheY-like chemotaxis protein